MKQQEFVGLGEASRLPQVLKDLQSKSVCLITGTSSWQNLSATFQNLLSEVTVYQLTHSGYPIQAEDLRKTIADFKRHEVDTVVAVGGGTVIDMAKMILSLSDEGNGLEHNIRENVIHRSPHPLIAMPTTAGSGSEATEFAVVYIGHDKFSIADKSLLPEAAIVDANLMGGMPPSVRASTGLDALSQAMESLWSVSSTTESRDYAREAIVLCMQNLEQSMVASSRNARHQMSRAANLAGKAINISRTTAPHAVSYPLTSRYGIAHGHAVALTLGEFLVFNAGADADSVIDSRGLTHLRTIMNELFGLMGCSSAEQANLRILVLMTKLGLETSLTKLGITSDSDIEFIISHVNIQRLNNNPRRIDEKSLGQILRTRMTV